MGSLFTFDGHAFKAVDKGFGDVYYSSLQDAIAAGNQSVVGGLNPTKAFNLVPWLFRAISIRASLVSRIPFALVRKSSSKAFGKSIYPSATKAAADFMARRSRFALKAGDVEVTDDPAYESLMKGFRNLLYMTEGSKVLTGAAYWWLETNEMGRNITPRFLRTPYVSPVVSNSQGLLGFTFSDAMEAAVPRSLAMDRMVYFWNPNFQTSAAPGQGEAAVALSAASMLYALDAFTAGYFNSGGVQVTVFEVPSNMPPNDKKDFQNFLDRSLSGVRNAFRNIAVRAGIKPTIIGSKVKDTEAPELTSIQRDNVAVAIGVPPPLLEGKNENKATADANELALYLRTILPEVDMLFETANEQLFNQFGVELVAKPDELEAMQTAQLAQAQAVSVVVGSPILTVDEGRDLLGYEPMGAAETPAPATDAADVEIASLSLWRDTVIEAMRAGKSTDVAVPDDLPLAFVQRVDRQLKTCKSVRQVRQVFEKNWPKGDELKRANDLLERALAKL